MQQSISTAAEQIRKNVGLSLVGAVLAVNLRYNKYM